MAVSGIDLGKYKLGWHDTESYAVTPKKGLNEQVVRDISYHKSEPEWMTKFRLNALKRFERKPMLEWFAKNMPTIDFDDIYYYLKPTQGAVSDWDMLPEEMKATFKDCYILLHEKKITAVKDLIPLLEAVSKAGKPLLILSEDIEGDALSRTLARVGREELQRIHAEKTPEPQGDLSSHHTPWRAFVTDRNVVLLSLATFCLGYVAYIYQSWFYLYLVNVRGFSVVRGGFFATGPFLAVTVLCPLGGLFSDMLTRRYGKTRGRRGAAVVALLASALCIYLGAGAANPYLAVLLLSLGDGLLYSTLGSTWSVIMDISGKYTGAVYGIVGMCANIGGMIAPTLTPLLAGRYGWEAAIHVAALTAFAGGMMWLAVDAGKRIAVEERVLVQPPEPVFVRDK